MRKDIWTKLGSRRLKDCDVLIMDGYVDEPSLLGVPPYLSPEPRKLCGVAERAGLSWEYVTADEYRLGGGILPEADHVLVHGGASVPGNYLSGTPLSGREAERIAETVEGTSYLGGPLARYEDVKGYDHYSERDLAVYYRDILRGITEPGDRWAKSSENERWLKAGARVVKRHPMFPDPLLVEVSTSRGCPRYFTGGCSFCSEPGYGRPDFREQRDITAEFEELYRLGVRHFRLGGQSCILSYKGKGVGKEEIIVPQPGEIEKLFSGIRSQCEEIRVLHVDNANPAVIAAYPERSRKTLCSIREHTTSGNVLALGMESADERVVEINNLNATPDQVEKAVKIVNEVGRERGENGLPELLPGLNFLGGLDGETGESYAHNIRFLKRLKKKGFLLRRINIRQVLSHRKRFKTKYRKEFRDFKEWVRNNFDRPMLQSILPRGSVLKQVFMEKREGKNTFGRQIGTYPLLVGVKYPLEIGRYYDIMITEHGYRSVTGVHHPFFIDEATFAQLQALPGIGKKRAARIFRHRPKNGEELTALLGDEICAEKIIGLVDFSG